jgi:hypothetical protein
VEQGKLHSQLVEKWWVEMAENWHDHFGKPFRATKVKHMLTF